MNRKHIYYLIILSILIIPDVMAAMPSLKADMQEMGSALAVLLYMVMGLKWIASDSATERGEAKKGMIYITVGLLIVYMVTDLINGLYCSAPNVTCP